VVSEKSGIDSISINDIAKILSGEFTNWSSLNLKSKPITIYGRQSNSGTHEYVRKLLNIHFSPRAKQMNGNAQILEAIKADASGIGYVSAGYIFKGRIPGIKVLPVYTDNSFAVSPFDSRAISTGEYYFQRPLFQYFRKNNYQKVKPFLDFEQSEKGLTIIKDMGYYPVIKN